MSYTDVTAAVLHTLCDIYRHIAVRGNAGLTVYFHFDYEDDNVRIISRRAEEATVAIVPKVQDNVLIRIPKWTPPESVRITVGGQKLPVQMIGGFAYVPRSDSPKQPETVLRYGLPIRTTTETIKGVEYRYTWRGDEITGVSPNTAVRPLYPTARDGE